MVLLNSYLVSIGLVMQIEIHFPFWFFHLRCFGKGNENYQDKLKKVLFPEKELTREASCNCLKNDGRTWLLFKVNAEYSGNSSIIHKLITISDVSKDIQRQEELTYLAYYDTMTGLYNRNYFIQCLNDFMHRAKDNNDLVSVLFIDIDDFRKINDSMGMLVGDEFFLECWVLEAQEIPFPDFLVSRA